MNSALKTIVTLVIGAAIGLTVAMLPSPAQEAAPATDTRSVEQRLADIETTLKRFQTDVGTISGRASIADYLVREFLSLNQKIDDCSRKIDRMDNSVRSMDRKIR